MLADGTTHFMTQQSQPTLLQGTVAMS